MYYNTKDDNGKKPLIVYGTFGIGKSHLIRQVAKDIAEQKGKKFVDWNVLTKVEKEIVFENTKDYFILLDIRLSEYDIGDIKGLPDFDDKRRWLEWKCPLIIKLLEQKDGDGILFFDEINLASTMMISSIYKILHDRVVNESRMADDWLIIGCGNKDDDRAYTHELASPVKDRAGEVELLPSSAGLSGEWTMWAGENGIDSRIISYLAWKPESLRVVNYDDGQKFTTPRGWERLSTLIKDISLTDYAMLELISQSAIGEGIAREFVAYCKVQSQVDIQAIIREPSKLRQLHEISMKYFVITAIAENYKEKISKVEFKDILNISQELDNMNNSEFVVMMWKLAIRYNPKKFSKDFTAKENINSPILQKYRGYLVD